MNVFVVPDDHDRAYVASPHLERLRPHGKVRVHTEPPRDEADLLARLAPATVLIPIRERTPVTAARLAETRGEGWRVLTRTEAGGYPYGCFFTAEPPG